ncbi:hypothetical protein AVEN_138494-1 [Araneus ventricosus]|uniref:Uncharacterized protein n=1 Tax=Araneus ventricosus TaxID=182803 RepID=A0A4Y2CEW0_ARAVE|nr:hypothetical protein AVEN_138494-1 [Araneus ventricosus]
MENRALFANIPERTKRRKQKKQHWYKLGAQTDSKSLIIAVTALSLPLGVYQLSSSNCGQNSKETSRLPTHSKDIQTHTRLSTSGYLYLFRQDETTHRII